MNPIAKSLRKAVAVAATAGACLTLTACGGGVNDTEKQFAARIDSTCLEFRKQVANASEAVKLTASSLDHRPTQTQSLAISRQIFRSFLEHDLKDFVDNLSELKYPPRFAEFGKQANALKSRLNAATDEAISKSSGGDSFADVSQSLKSVDLDFGSLDGSKNSEQELIKFTPNCNFRTKNLKPLAPAAQPTAAEKALAKTADEKIESKYIDASEAICKRYKARSKAHPKKVKSRLTSMGRAGKSERALVNEYARLAKALIRDTMTPFYEKTTKLVAPAKYQASQFAQRAAAEAVLRNLGSARQAAANLRTGKGAEKFEKSFRKIVLKDAYIPKVPLTFLAAAPSCKGPKD